MAKATPKKSDPKACLCGCGEMTGGGRFRPGHDAKLKSALTRLIREGKGRSRTAAANRMKEMGWERHIPTISKEANGG